MAEILIVDDDEDICAALSAFLTDAGYTTHVAGHASDAVRMVRDSRPDLVLMDIRLPGSDGLEALRSIREGDPTVCVVIMTAYGTSQTSIEAMRLGAYEYLTKPLDLDVLKPLIERALETRALSREVSAEPQDDWGKYSLVNLVGASAPMEAVYKQIGLLTTNDVPVLVVGGRGVGKELVARTIHFNSARRGEPFAAIACVVPESVLEREIFGEETSSGAGERVLSPGKIETARGGTLFLDEVAALSASLQSKVRRLLVDGAFERVGGASTLRAEVRIMAASEEDLEERVREESFSRDLYEGLSIISIRLPPLCERRDDISELVTHFVTRCNDELNKGIRGIDERVKALFDGHPWPGNVAELERVIKRACILARGEIITPDDLGGGLETDHAPDRSEAESALARAVRGALEQRLSEGAETAAGPAFHGLIAQVERVLVGEALALTGGNQVQAAELLGLNRSTLRSKMRLYNLR